VKLSIIIVNYKAWGHLCAALDNLRYNFPDDWEVIVIDNESESTVFNEYRNSYPWVNMIGNPANSGFGFGCILGVAEASGERLLFMNPDVVATVDEIRTLIQEKVRHPDVAILSPRQVGTDGRSQKVFDEFPNLLNQSKTLKAVLRVISPGRTLDPRAHYDALVYCDWVTGSFLLIDHEDYNAIGGWCADYWMYVEDADLCRRACLAGLRVAYTPAVQVVHAHGGSSRINVAVKSMTKLEVIISKHVYTWHHTRGLKRWLTHSMIIALRLPGLAIAALLDLLTLQRVPALRVRSRMLTGLLSYYAGVIKDGTWLSPRAQTNQA
jgi:GT2 family glycosyltransferase